MARQPKFAVVTGASSGIGYELARVFAKNGFDLIVCAEDNEINSAAADFSSFGVEATPVKADLASYEGVEQLWREVQASGRQVDAVAINAGVGVGGDFTRETDLKDELNIVQLNCASVVHLAKRVLPQMVARGEGRVLITSSIAGEMPTPLQAVYGASKAFDLSFARSLRSELEGSGVTVTALQPGATDTNFFERANMEGTKVAESAKQNDPADVAQQGFDAMMRGEDHIYGASTLSTKVMGSSLKFMPEKVKAEMHKKEAKPKTGTD